jgi:hypothetical protein
LLHVEICVAPGANNPLDFSDLTEPKVIAVNAVSGTSYLTLGLPSGYVIDYLLLLSGSFSLTASGKAKTLYLASTASLAAADSATVTTGYAYIYPTSYSTELVAVLETPKLALIHGAADTISPITVIAGGLQLGNTDVAASATPPEIVVVLLDGTVADQPLARTINLVPKTGGGAGFPFTISHQVSVLDTVIPPAQATPTPVAGTLTITATATTNWESTLGPELTVNLEPDSEDAYPKDADYATHLVFHPQNFPTLFTPPSPEIKQPSPEEGPGGETSSSAPPDINAHGIDVLCYGSATACDARKAAIYTPLLPARKGLWVQVTPGDGKLKTTLVSAILLPNYLLHVELLVAPTTGTNALDFTGITAHKVIAIKGLDSASPLTLPNSANPVIDYLILLGGTFGLAADAQVNALYVAASATLNRAATQKVTTVYAYSSPAKASALAPLLASTAKLCLVYGAADTVATITVTTTGLTVGTLAVSAGGDTDPHIVIALLDGEDPQNVVARSISLVPPVSPDTRGPLAFTISRQGSVISAVIPPAYTPANPVAGTFTLTTGSGAVWTTVTGAGLTVYVQPSIEGESYSNKDGLTYTKQDVPVLFTPPVVNKVTPTQEPEEAGDTATIQTPGSADEGTGTQTTQAAVIETPNAGGGANDDDGGLSGGAIAGIVIGVVAAVGIAGFCVWYFVLRPKKIGVEGAKP